MFVTNQDAKEDHGKKTQFNLLLIEDNPTDTLIVRSHIQQFADFILHSVATLSEAVESLNSRSFDLILLDLNLPDAAGLEGLIKLQHYVQKVPIVVLTGVDSAELGIMALQRGAQDYLIKDTDSHRLVKAIRYAIERILAHDSESSMLGQLDLDTIETNAVIKNNPNTSPYELLTRRELQVLKLLGNGCNNQEIAERLLISMNTVKTHVASILHKFSVTDRSKAIIQAQRQGLI